jgi:hypothetical protein
MCGAHDARTCADGTHRLKHLLRRQRPVAPEESRGPVPRTKHSAPGTNYVEVVVSASYETRLPDNEVLRTMHEAVRTGNNELGCNCLVLSTRTTHQVRRASFLERRRNAWGFERSASLPIDCFEASRSSPHYVRGTRILLAWTS